VEIYSDYLVIGSGVAGLIFSIKASKYGKVSIITKKSRSDANTNYAQGGIATVFDEHDSFEMHIKDTLKTGCGLSHEDVVNMVIKNGPRVVQELMTYGVNFTEEDGKLDLGREGGHSRNRIVHAKDLTGFEIEQRLLEKIRNNPNIDMVENQMALDLILNDDGRCIGVKSLDRENYIINHYIAKFVLLATGGASRIYRFTTNPLIATGDGIAMAYLAGASVGNMEFVQFHPTSLYEKAQIEEKSFLISEAVRGAGAVLKTPDGVEFMDKYHELKSLAPRDIVARAIDNETKKHGYEYVYLDLSSIPEEEIKRKFPNILNACAKRGIYPPKDMIPVIPAAHYFCGGIKTDRLGLTDIEGLYAAGEVAFTGLHGANRLASNSLLEALVFSENAFKDTLDKLDINVKFNYNKEKEKKLNFIDSDFFDEDRDKIRNTMWDYVGIVRNDNRLKSAHGIIKNFNEKIEEMIEKGKFSSTLFEMRNMGIVALLVIESSLLRKESRGLNYNEDYPEEKDEFKHDTILKRRMT